MQETNQLVQKKQKILIGDWSIMKKTCLDTRETTLTWKCGKENDPNEGFGSEELLLPFHHNLFCLSCVSLEGMHLAFLSRPEKRKWPLNHNSSHFI